MKTYLKLIDEIQDIGQKHNQTDMTQVCRQLIELLQEEKPKSAQEKEAIDFAIQQLEATDLDGAYRTLEPFAVNDSSNLIKLGFVVMFMLAIFMGSIYYLQFGNAVMLVKVRFLSVLLFILLVMANAIRLSWSFYKSPKTIEGFATVFISWAAVVILCPLLLILNR